MRQTFEDKKRSTLDAMAYSGSVGLTALLDQVLFPTPGPLAPTQALSNLDHYRMYDSWLALHREGRTFNALGQLINDGEQISRQDALRLFTRSNCWFLRMEDKLGSIEVGKLADLVVLDRDFFTVPDQDIKRVRSVLTVVGGRSSTMRAC